MKTGEHILSLRKEQGKSRRVLSELSGVSESAIKQYETGKRQPKLEQLQRIAAALSVSVEILIYGTDGTFTDSDGVKYSGSHISQKEIDEDDLFDYHEKKDQRFGGTWSQRVIETLQTFPEDELQRVLDYIEFQRQQIQNREGGKGGEGK